MPSCSLLKPQVWLIVKFPILSIRTFCYETKTRSDQAAILQAKAGKQKRGCVLNFL
jgi:hypothetical protein